MNVLIIEDEELAQEELVRLIRKRYPSMKISALIGSVKESVEWLQENTADLIFMDIQLSDGISFDIFDYIDIRTPIIFTTAYDQYAIQAFKVNSIGYLLKPIIESDLVSTIEKLEYQPDKLKELLKQLQPSISYKSRIMIKTGDKYSFLDINDIAYFYAEERVTIAVPKQGRAKIVDYTIESLETKLDPKQFFKLTRGCIASINSIKEVSKYFNSRLKVRLSPEYTEEILISRIRVGEFLQWLNGD